MMIAGAAGGITLACTLALLIIAQTTPLLSYWKLLFIPLPSLVASLSILSLLSVFLSCP